MQIIIKNKVNKKAPKIMEMVQFIKDKKGVEREKLLDNIVNFYSRKTDASLLPKDDIKYDLLLRITDRVNQSLKL